MKIYQKSDLGGCQKMERLLHRFLNDFEAIVGAKLGGFWRLNDFKNDAKRHQKYIHFSRGPKCRHRGGWRNETYTALAFLGGPSRYLRGLHPL